MKFRIQIFKVENGKDILVTEDDFEADNVDDFQLEYEDVFWNREDEIQAALDG